MHSKSLNFCPFHSFSEIYRIIRRKRRRNAIVAAAELLCRDTHLQFTLLLKTTVNPLLALFYTLGDWALSGLLFLCGTSDPRIRDDQR